MITTADLKTYLRIDYNDDDTIVARCLSVATAYAFEKTGVEYINNDDLYDQLILFLAQHYYDNRTALTDKALIESNFTITDLIKTIEVRGAMPNVVE